MDATAHTESGPGYDEEDMRRVRAYLASLGASEDAAEDAVANRTVGGLALDLALRGDRPTTPFGRAAEELGLPFDDAARFWRALGLPEPTPTSPELPPDAVQAMALLVTAGRPLLGDDASLALARVMGSATARLAQAVVDVFRVEFETRELGAGRRYSDVLQDYVAMARTMLPVFLDALGAILVRHLVNVASGAWQVDAEGSAAQRDAAVGFVDLVGYTALSQTLRPGELARLIEEFEELVNEATVRRGGRVVKLIGDAAMFVADDVATGCCIALDIVRSPGAVGRLPARRAGLAAGDVVTLHGDVYGDVVNLAARLVAVAPEASVVVADEARRRVDADAGLAFEPLPPQSLKGFGAPADAFVVAPA